MHVLRAWHGHLGQERAGHHRDARGNQGELLRHQGTAEAESAYGASFISVRYESGYLHIMQMSDAGPLYVTTVLARAAGEGKLMAIHTRIEYSPTIIPGFTSRPEMYLGTCTIANPG